MRVLLFISLSPLPSDPAGALTELTQPRFELAELEALRPRRHPARAGEEPGSLFDSRNRQAHAVDPFDDLEVPLLVADNAMGLKREIPLDEQDHLLVHRRLWKACCGDGEAVHGAARSAHGQH